MTDDPQKNTQESSEDKAFQALDTAKYTSEIKQQITPEVEKLAEKKAEEIAARKVEERMKDLGKRISGEESDDNDPYSKHSKEWTGKDQYGNVIPKDWKEAMRTIDKVSDERAEQKLKKWQEEQKKSQEKQHKLTQKQQAFRDKLDSDSYWDLVKKGAVPAPTEEVRKKLDQNIQLTEEEKMKDPGMRAFNEIRQRARTAGKTFKEYVYEDYNKQPPGAHAPVLGGSYGSTMQSQDEYSYKDIEEDGKRLLQ